MKVHQLGKNENGDGVILATEEIGVNPTQFRMMRSGRLATEKEMKGLPLPDGHIGWLENHRSRVWAVPAV